MAITNGYATLAEFKSLKDIATTDAADDAEIENIVTRASRMIDTITGYWFYAATLTHYFDVPDGREILFDFPLLTATTVTNGDTTVITSTYYKLLPYNLPQKYSIRLKQSTTYYWSEDSNGDTEGVISIAGTWGYCDRTATDPISARVIQNTNYACLEIAKMWYHERFGENLGGNTIITAAGVVQTPAGAIPKSAYEAIKPYIRIV